MAEQYDPQRFEPGVRSLYVQKLSRLSFQPTGELHEALLGMHSEEARSRMGQSALFLYSQPQEETFRPGSEKQRKSEQRDSNLMKKLGVISTRQFDLAKWIGLKPSKNKRHPGFHIYFNVLLDPDTQVQLHASTREGLDQTKFGRRAVLASLWIPEDDFVQTDDEWQHAAKTMKAVVWGNDALDTAAKTISPPESGGGARVAHIKWTSWIISGDGKTAS
jgi:hypothetical protein